MVMLEDRVKLGGPLRGEELVVFADDLAAYLVRKQSVQCVSKKDSRLRFGSYSLAPNFVFYENGVTGLVDQGSDQSSSDQSVLFSDIFDYGKTVYFAATGKKFDEKRTVDEQLEEIKYKELSVLLRDCLGSLEERRKRFSKNGKDGALFNHNKLRELTTDLVFSYKRNRRGGKVGVVAVLGTICLLGIASLFPSQQEPVVDSVAPYEAVVDSSVLDTAVPEGLVDQSVQAQRVDTLTVEEPVYQEPTPQYVTEDDVAAIARAYGVVYKKHSDDKIDSVPVIYRLTLNTTAERIPGKKYGENYEEGRVNLLTANLASYHPPVTLDELMDRTLYSSNDNYKDAFIVEWKGRVE
jgi:hypothetical protein